MKKKDSDLTQEQLKKLILDLGADLYGVADMTNVETDDFLIDAKLLTKFPFAISIAKKLSKAILEEIIDHPTKLYFHHYRTINMFLDQLATRIASEIEKAGYLALPIPASQIVDWQNQKAHLSHKRIAEVAGLGWIGRNNLLVTPEYGAQIRLVTILTDMPLSAVSGQRSAECDDCFECIKVCPAQAIKERKQDFDHIKCFEKLKEFQKKGYSSQYICGVCVKACKGNEI